MIREIAIPAPVRRRARGIALLDLESATPFNLDNAYVGHRIVQQADATWHVQQVVAKRDLLADLLDDLQKHKITVRRVAAVISDETDVLELSSRQPMYRSGLERFLYAAALSAIAAAAMLAIALGIVAVNNQTRDIATLDKRIHAIRNEALVLDRARQAATTRLTVARSVVERRLMTFTALDILNEVTRILPDNVWIKEFRLRAKVLHLTGIAVSPEDLIKRLTHSPMFKNARFSSALVTASGAKRVQFQLRLDIAQSIEAGTGRQ